MPCCHLLTFSKTLFFKNSFRNTTRGSNELDPDQDRCFVIPDLGSNCLQLQATSHLLEGNTVKPVLSGHSKRRPKIGFQDQLSLNAGQKYCRMLQQSILEYFRPLLSYHLSLRLLFCLFLSGRLRQVLL